LASKVRVRTWNSVRYDVVRPRMIFVAYSLALF
jgi:hypothetical protein